MASKKSPKKPKSGLTVKAYRGDAKTLLAFNLPKEKTKNLAGFTVKVAPGNKAPFYLQNQLRFEDPTKHAQDAKLPANSSFNAPIHKFRWLHVPGSLQQRHRTLFRSIHVHGISSLCVASTARTRWSMVAHRTSRWPASK